MTEGDRPFNGWGPAETAWRDGRRILIIASNLLDNRRWAVVRWHPGLAHFVDDGDFPRTAYDPDGDIVFWTETPEAPTGGLA